MREITNRQTVESLIKQWLNGGAIRRGKDFPFKDYAFIDYTTDNSGGTCWTGEVFPLPEYRVEFFRKHNISVEV